VVVAGDPAMDPPGKAGVGWSAGVALGGLLSVGCGWLVDSPASGGAGARCVAPPDAGRGLLGRFAGSWWVPVRR
jgi:hypothetical protein